MHKSLLEKANHAFRQGKYKEALAAYQEFKNRYPEFANLVDLNIALIQKKYLKETQPSILGIKSEKIIVYTCNFGNYESVKEPLYIDSSVEYLLFTDNKNIRSKNWKIVVVEEKLEDPRRLSRLPKILPHKYLPEHDISVYIDSSLELKAEDVRKMVSECMEGSDIALYKHYLRNCVYDEIEFVMNSTDRVVTNRDLCLKALEKYKSINYPRNNGLFENAFIFRRNTKEIKELNELWWKEYAIGAERDQFTFMYALWMTKITPNTIKRGKQFRSNDYVNFYKHQYKSYGQLNKKTKNVHVFIAYAPKSYGMNLGRCYNEYMERLNDDDIALFIDHDAMFVSDSWAEIVNDITRQKGDEISLFIGQTNRINNPYQRLNLLEENHRIEDHRIFADEVADRFSSSTVECSKLPSSSGVVIMLSKKTWNKHKFTDGFLKVDNNIHLSHRASGDPVYLMQGLFVYHFYRADNDFSHVVRDISLLPKENESTTGHVVRNFVYREFSISEIDRYMKTLKDGEYGVFLPDQSMFCTKDWYIQTINLLEKDPDIGIMIYSDNDLDDDAPFELDVLKHKIYSANMVEREPISLLNLDIVSLSKQRRAFFLSKEVWNTATINNPADISLMCLVESAIKIKKKASFIPGIYVINTKIDNRKNKAKKYFDKKLNIGILTLGFWPQQAGMEMMVHNLASQMTLEGNNVVLFAPKPKKEFTEIKSRYIVRRFNDFENMKLLFKEHHNSMPFDVLYVQGAFEPASIALEIKRELGIPVVLRTHGEDIQIDKDSNYGYRLDPEKDKIILNNIRDVDHNIVIGPHIYLDVKEITSGPVSLIFNGVDTDHFVPGRKNLIHEKLNLPETTKVLITVGRNVKKKSLHLAIDALAIVKQSFPDVILVHIGKEGNGLDLREYANQLGVSDRFYQLGEVNYFEMPNFYQSSDIFVFPSKTETFGNVTAEAMACGLPCVEFDYEVNRDKIISGVTGYIVDYGNTDLLAEAISQLLKAPELIKEMGKSARRHAVNKFSWINVRKQYKEIFMKYKN